MDSSRFKIIGISGTNGSGKDTLGHMLAKYHKYLFISVTELLREECQRQGLNVTRENLRKISAEWRRQNGLGVLVDRAYEEYIKVQKQYSGVALASLRNPGEADRVHDLAGIVVWLDADPKIRYDRIINDLHIRTHRTDEDTKTYEEFLAEEQAEMYAGGDAATLNMAAVKEQADITINNSNDDPNSFRPKAEQALGL